MAIPQQQIGMSAAKVDALTPWTDAQLILLYRDALANGWGGTQRNISGKMVTFAEPNVLLDIIERLEARIRAASDDVDADANGGVAIAVFPNRC